MIYRRSSSSGDSTNRPPPSAKPPLQKKNSSGSTTTSPQPGPRYLWIRLALFEKQLAVIIDYLVQNSRSEHYFSFTFYLATSINDYNGQNSKSFQLKIVYS